MQVRSRSLSENKYACSEYERRLLLQEAPPSIDAAKHARIVDHYLPGKRMRLRRMEWPNHGIVEYKFGLKFPDPSLPDGCVALTNLYLTENEYDHLRLFGGSACIVKRRYPFVHAGVSYGIDVFEGQHAGLVLAEIGFETADEYARFQMPDFALADVTTEVFFTSGELATVPESILRRVLDDRLRRR
jgi:hypothetical protein